MSIPRSDLSVGQLELALLRIQLKVFEARFYQAVGRSYFDLDEARAQAAKLRARFVPSAHRDSKAAREQALAIAAAYAQAVPANSPPEPAKLKALHHELARACHPDLSPDEARKRLREQLMTQINLAAQSGDLRRLELLFACLENHSGKDAATAVGEIARQPLNKLRLRVEDAAARNVDLLHLLRSHVQRVTSVIRQQGREVLPQANTIDLAERALRDLDDLTPAEPPLLLPAEDLLGRWFIRPAKNTSAPLKPVAAGTLELPKGTAVLLRLSAKCKSLEPLAGLPPDALHGFIDEWPDFVALHDAMLEPLAAFPGLEVLHLGRTAITGHVFDGFRSLRELRVLVLEETQFDDHGLARLRECIWMQRLDLSFTAITGAGLNALRDMCSLQELSLYGTSIGDAGLEFLQRTPHLRNLNLGLTAVTDASAGLLGSLEALEVLNLGGTAMTDGALHALCALPRLQELVLWETVVTDAALEDLSRVTTLRYLDVDQTAVTPEAIASFHQRRPDVRLPGDIWQAS